MRLRRPTQEYDREKLRELKPKPGDVILYESREYIVRDVGLRYLHAYRRDGTTKTLYLLKIKDIVKTGERVDLKTL